MCLAVLLTGSVVLMDGSARLYATADPLEHTATVGKTFVPFQDVQPLLRILQPGDQRGLVPPGISATSWPAWVRTRDREIRARLERGDEDSVVNLWMFGTSFTREARLSDQAWSGLDNSPDTYARLDRRLSDLIAGASDPGDNERLQFVRQVLTRRGMDPSIAANRDLVVRYLSGVRDRMMQEVVRARLAGEAAVRARDDAGQFDAYAGFYRARGLSSDTSLLANFSVDRAIGRLAALDRGTVGPIRHVAVVGPGLDFADKAGGYDFYPPQTMQPFLLLDSLRRTGLIGPERVELTTFDVSPRINQHLRAAIARARAGTGYRLQLPLATDTPDRAWDTDLVSYAARAGDRIGNAVAPLAPPPGITDVRVRAVAIRPAIVTSITSRDLDIVVERLAPLAPPQRFDLIVATNILIYYAPFDQGLAMTNVSAMLRPGGWFLVNSAVFSGPTLSMVPGLTTTVNYDQARQMGDQLFWYRRP